MERLKKLLRREPVLVASALAAIVVAGASLFGVVLDEQSVLDAILQAFVILGLGSAARSRVSPS